MNETKEPTIGESLKACNEYLDERQKEENKKKTPEEQIKELKSNLNYANLRTLLLTGITAFTFGINAIGNHTHKRFYKTKEVSPGYIAPSRLEITCQDLDRNGSQETIMHIDSTKYLLREIDGQPTLTRYSVTQPEIIPYH